jgi:hypothetical protein
MTDSFTIGTETRSRLLAKPYEELAEGFLSYQRLVAILLAKLGGNVRINSADEIDLDGQIVVCWAPEPDMTRRVQLLDRFGTPWQRRPDDA